MKNKELAEIISDGKQLALSLYEQRNEIISETNTGTNQLLASELLEAHDDLVVRFAHMEKLLVPDDTKSEKKRDVTRLNDVIISWMPDEWTFNDLAKASGVTLSTIHNIVKGKNTPRRSTLAKIEGALGMTEGALDV